MDGQTKIVNQKLGNIIQCLAGENIKQWDELLAQAKFAYNSMTNRTTARSPLSIVYTKHLNHTVNLAILTKSRSKTAEKYSSKIFRNDSNG